MSDDRVVGLGASKMQVLEMWAGKAGFADCKAKMSLYKNDVRLHPLPSWWVTCCAWRHVVLRGACCRQHKS